MAQQLFNYEYWLQNLMPRLEAFEIFPGLTLIAHELQQHFEARVWFADIYGRRWSYITGCQWDVHALNLPQRHNLGNRTGIVIATRGNLPDVVLRGLLEFLKGWLELKVQMDLPEKRFA